MTLTQRGSRIASVGTALPPHRHTQQELTAMFADLVGLDGGARRTVLDGLHGNSGVATRHIALPLGRYAELDGFTAANDEFLVHAVELSAAALEDALARAGVRAEDVDTIITATVTGLAVPSLDARLVGRCGLREDVVRMPLVGLGCVAGAAGVARAHDVLRGRPDGLVALVCVELCSLTVQRDDRSMANLVASGLFGDGAACVLLAGPDHPLAQAPTAPPADGAALATTHPAVSVRDSRSRFYAGTDRAMGFDVGGHGLRIVLDAQVPGLVLEHVRADVDGFLTHHGLTRADIGFWVAHPGGPKVLQAMESALETAPGALDVTWRSLERIGNLSSASVLHVLHDTLVDHPPEPESLGLLLAMGPGFCAEMVLLEASS